MLGCLGLTFCQVAESLNFFASAIAVFLFAFLFAVAASAFVYTSDGASSFFV